MQDDTLQFSETHVMPVINECRNVRNLLVAHIGNGLEDRNIMHSILCAIRFFELARIGF